jgi:RNA polymerase sigma-70 factor (ECF subfamily)
MSKRTQKAELKDIFSTVYAEQADPIFRFALYKISDREKAKDIVQEVFVKFWEYLVAGTTVENPKALLFRMASNVVIDHYRRHKNISLDFLMEDGYDPADNNQAEHIVDAAEGGLAIKLLNKLDEPLKDVLILRYVEGLSVKEIADIQDERENTISVRLHRALKELRDLYEHNDK